MSPPALDEILRRGSAEARVPPVDCTVRRRMTRSPGSSLLALCVATMLACALGSGLQA
jgi:hypothetical protein